MMDELKKDGLEDIAELIERAIIFIDSSSLPISGVS